VITDEQLSWLKLTLVPGLGPAHFNKLLETFHSPEAILDASQTQLQSSGLSTKLCQSLKETDEKQLQHVLSWLESSANHHLVCINDQQYPALLKSIHDAPLVLFVHGEVALLSQHQIAMVGSRNPTRGGQETAYAFAKHLASTGLIITSGLALGVDGASHQGALDTGSPTIAVTGNGLDRVYPARHRDLAHQIAEQGALVSEFPPGTKPLPHNFPRRNRIIAGLSLGTLVVEAAQKSGSLITAYKALEQSREVFAIPGSIHNPLARGCHQLIRQGAKLVETAQDVLEELSSIAQASFEMSESPAKPVGVPPVQDESHQVILDAMAYDPVNIDTLANRTGMTAHDISSILLILELEGTISSQPGGRYIRNGQT